MKRNGMAAASMLALAAALSMPPLGQQRQIAERPNSPTERLRPPPPKKSRRKTQDDIDAMHLAEVKREVKRARNTRLQAAGAFRQLAASKPDKSTGAAISQPEGSAK